MDLQQRQYDEHQEFNEAHQECEKWLLQMSFRIMAHNSLNVSTMELTERQIEKHRVGTCYVLFTGFLPGPGLTAKGSIVDDTVMCLPYIHVRNARKNVAKAD